MNGLEQLDLALLDWINPDEARPFLDAFFTWLSKPPQRVWIFLVAALALVAWKRKRAVARSPSSPSRTDGSHSSDAAR